MKNKTVVFNAAVFASLFFIGLLLYLIPVPHGVFHFDDINAIQENPVLKSLDIPKIFQAFNTRFLVGLSFALNRHWCGIDGAGFRLTNLIIHCANACLVFILLGQTLPRYLAQARWASIFGAFLFLCHPIPTEPVNFITQRFVLMGTFFYLLAMVLYVQSRLSPSRTFLVMGIIAAAADMFCKEFVVTLPVMMAVYEVYFLRGPKDALFTTSRRLAPFFAVVLIVPILLMHTSVDAVGVARIAQSSYRLNHKSERVISHIDITRANGSIGRSQYFLTELNVIWTYIRLLFVPVNQNVDYDYPLAQGLDNKTAVCGFGLVCLMLLAVLLRRKRPLASFGIWWFFIALSIESSFIPIGHVIAEYRVYLASVGFVFIVADCLYGHKLDLKAAAFISLIIIAVLSVLTFKRNEIWKTEFTLWDDAVKKSPHKARPYNNRGDIYLQRGEVDRAMADYKKSIELDPHYAQAYNNLGVIYQKQKKFDVALNYYSKAIELNPTFENIFYNRGAIYADRGQLAAAIADFSMAIQINPRYAQAYSRRGKVYAKQGKLNEAMADFAEALKIDPARADTYIDRGIVYTHQDDFRDAVLDFDQAITLHPKLAEGYNNRGSALDKEGIFNDALKDYNKAIELDPQYAEAYYNRSFLVAGQGDLTQALADCNKAIKLKKDYAEAYNNRGVIEAKTGRFKEALADFNRAIKLKKDYAEAYNNRGLLYDREHLSDKALADYNQAIALNQAYVDAYYNRGNVYYKQGRFRDALSDFDKVIEIKPGDLGIYYNRAVIYYELKEYDKSWEDVDKTRQLGGMVSPVFIKALKEASPPALST